MFNLISNWRNTNRKKKNNFAYFLEGNKYTSSVGKGVEKEQNMLRGPLI